MAERARSEEPFVLKDVSALKAMADPLRIQIVMELTDRPRTVKDVARQLDVPQTRLYYHFKLLAKAGLIHVVETRLVSGIEERSYQAASLSVGPDVTSIPALVKEGVIDAMLSVVRAELELALTTEAGTPVGRHDAPVPMLSFTRLDLTPDAAEELQTRLQAVLEDFALTEPSEDTRSYHALLTWYEAPDELRKRNIDAS